MIYALLAGLCFGFAYLGYYIGAEQSDAEKGLQANTAAWWAAAAAALNEIDFVVFTAIAIQDQSVWRASAVSFLPSVAGAWLGERASVRKNWVSERMKAARRAKKAEEIAKMAPS